MRVVSHTRATSDLGERPARRAVAQFDGGQREAAARVEMAHDAPLLVEAHALAHGNQVRLGQEEVGARRPEAAVLANHATTPTHTPTFTLCNQVQTCKLYTTRVLLLRT